MEIDAISIESSRIQKNQNSVVIVKPAADVAYYPNQSTTINSSVVQWTNINSPSPNSILDKRVLLKIPISILITSTNVPNNGYILKHGQWGVRNFGNIVQSMSVEINGFRMNIELNKIYPAMSVFYNAFENDGTYGSLNNPGSDSFGNYNLQNLDNGMYANRSTLGTIFDAPIGAAAGRGQSSQLYVKSNVKKVDGTREASAEIEGYVYTYLVLPPFLFNTMKNDSGIRLIETLGITLNLAHTNTLFKWARPSVDYENVTLGVDVKVGGAASSKPATALICYLTPRINTPIPTSVNYPYYSITTYESSDFTIKENTPANIAALEPAGSTEHGFQTTELYSSTIQLSSVPDKVYVYATYENSIKDNPSYQFEVTDSFFPITRLQVNFNNRNALLAGATPEQLYLMSVKNGLRMTFDDFSGFVQGEVTGSASTADDPRAQIFYPLKGSVVCFTLDDIGGSDFIPGQLGKFTMQVNATIFNNRQRNYSGNTDRIVLRLITVHQGQLVINRNSAASFVGFSEDLIKNTPTEYIDSSYTDYLFGGNFFSKVTGLTKKALPYAKKLNKILKDKKILSQGAELLADVGVPYASLAKDGLSAVGYGMNAGGMNAGMMGGAMVPKGTLKNRLKK